MDEILKLLKKNQYKVPKGFLKAPKFDNKKTIVPKGFLKTPKLSKEQKKRLKIQKDIRKKQSLERDPSGMTQLLNQGGLVNGQGAVIKPRKFKVY